MHFPRRFLNAGTASTLIYKDTREEFVHKEISATTPSFVSAILCCRKLKYRAVCHKVPVIPFQELKLGLLEKPLHDDALSSPLLIDFAHCNA